MAHGARGDLGADLETTTHTPVVAWPTVADALAAATTPAQLDAALDLLATMLGATRAMVRTEPRPPWPAWPLRCAGLQLGHLIITWPDAPPAATAGMMEIVASLVAQAHARVAGPANLAYAADGLLVLQDDHIESVNAAACELLGRTEQELVGQPYATLLDPTDLAALPLQTAGSMSGATVRVQRQFLTGSGALLPVELIGRRLPDGRLQVLFRDQQQRRDMENQLRRSEARWRSLVLATAQIVWTTDANGDVIEDLPAWRAFTGQTREELQGQGWLDAVHPEDLPRSKAVWHRAMQDKTAHENEFRVRRHDGDWRHIAARVVPVLAETGDVREWVGTCTDVTDRRATQRALHAKQEELRLITDTVPVLIAHVDQTLRFRFANRAWENWFTRSHDDVVGRSLPEVLGQEGFQALQPEVERVLAGQRVTFEHRLPQAQGTGGTRLVHGDLLPRCTASGEVEGFVAMFVDLTDRDRYEQELFKKEEDLRVITDLVPVMISFVDRNHIFRFVNKAYEAFYGRPARDIEGLRGDELLGADLFDSLRPDMDRALAGEHVTFEREMDLPGIGSRWLHLEYMPRKSRDGEVEGFVVLGLDLTERKRADEALQRSEDQLRQSQKMDAIGRLAGGIAHDFNNLLTAINGYSELLMLMLRPDDPLHAHAEEIRRAGERAAALTRQLLTFSRKQVLQPKFLSPAAIVGDMDRMLRRLISERIDLVVTALDTTAQVKADPSQLEQVLLNLVINARDAMPHGGRITVKTDVAAWKGGDTHTFLDAPAGEYVRLTVEDQGPGISREARAHLFEPFFSTKATGKGTGLGLSTVYGIVKQAGGALRVLSTPGKGAKFEVWLPRVVVPEARRTSSGAVEPVALPRGSETVLLVEDESAVRQLVARVLQSSGYRVLEAASGQEGWQTFQANEEHIDLLLTDVVMPGLGGRELAERVRGRRPDVKVLYMSGYTDDPGLRQVLMHAHASLMPKPFSPRTVAHRVREMLDATPVVGSLRRQMHS